MKRKFNQPKTNLPIVSEHSSSVSNGTEITTLVTSETHVVTGSIDGCIKIYSINQDINTTIECVKSYDTVYSNKPVKQLLLNGTKLASLAENDNGLKIFDLNTLDMIQTVELPFIPNVSSSTSNSWYTDDKILISSNENELYCVALEEDDDDSFTKLKNPHKFPIISMSFNSEFKCFITIDEKGLIEVWDPQTFEIPTTVQFKMKSLTDLFYFRKNKLIVDWVALSSSGEMFACGYDRGIKVYSMKTGKIIHSIDCERVSSSEIIFDKNLVVYSTTKGIEVHDLNRDETEVIGSDDKVLFNNFGVLKNTQIDIITTEMITSDNALINSKLNSKPMLVASAVNAEEIYIFNDSSSSTTTSTPPVKKATNYTKVTLNTTKGDIKIELYSKLTPKTVENFITLCKRSYYNNLIFHRVIPEFMIQTGDPKGDGTGGESCWGGYFEDEFTPELSHEKYMVSMANAGPNTNGSQFFITTEDANFLDNKHTVFGKVISGIDVIQSIENVETDEDDKPLDRIVILSTTLER